MKSENGRVLPMLLCVVALFVMVIGTALAANNDPPEGWALSNRTRAGWALGKPLFVLCSCPTTSTLTASDIDVGDYVAGVINLSDTDDAQPALSTLTITADTITATGTPFSTGEDYIVVLWRPKTYR